MQQYAITIAYGSCVDTRNDHGRGCRDSTLTIDGTLPVLETLLLQLEACRLTPYDSLHVSTSVLGMLPSSTLATFPLSSKGRPDSGLLLFALLLGTL